MLFHVEMEVRIPHDLPTERADALKQAERVRAMVFLIYPLHSGMRPSASRP